MSNKSNAAQSADLLARRMLNTRWGSWEETAFRVGKDDIIALAFGSWDSDDEVIVRLHSTCLAAHYLESTECDCREQLSMAFQRIVNHGRGVLVFLEQDGRNNGQVALMRAAEYAKSMQSTQSEAYAALGYPADNRRFEGGAAVLAAMRVGRALTLTNNARKIEALRAFGIRVESESLIAESSTETGRRFYRDKALEGYLINPEEL